MRLEVNGEVFTLPSDLSEITLGQRIDYQKQHGDQLDEMLASILEMPEGEDRELETLEFQAEKMFRTVSFFTGIPVEVLKNSSFVNDIATAYNASVSVLFQDEDDMELEQEFAWNGKIWRLYPVELKNGDKLTFGQLADAKQTVKDMIKLGHNQWEYLKPLCAIYLRQEDEEYQESFIFEGSERLELMNELPLNIALQVGFFLLSTQSIWMNTFQFSGPHQLKSLESIRDSTLRSGDG